MHFYTALDWTCQDWTRADLPFSHCALGRQMGSPNVGIFVFVGFFFFNGDVESLLHSALEQNRGLLKCCMGVGRGGHPHRLWERRGSDHQQPWAGPLGLRSAQKPARERTAAVKGHAEQGRRPTAWCLWYSPASLEVWSLALRSKRVPHWEVVWASVLDHQIPTRSGSVHFLKKASKRAKKQPMQTEERCRTDCPILRITPCTTHITLICMRFAPQKCQNLNPGAQVWNSPVPISAVVFPFPHQKTRRGALEPVCSAQTTLPGKPRLAYTSLCHKKSEMSH